MAGMLQILTYMFAFYLLVKAAEVLQIALASSRTDRAPMVGLAVLVAIACAIAAYAYPHWQDAQAASLQGGVSSIGSDYSNADEALRAAQEAADAADQAAAAANDASQ